MNNKKPKKFTTVTFRKELIKTMPKYKWTVHRPLSAGFLEAVGIQTVGFNRLSTLSVHRRINKDSTISYEVTSAGFGKGSPWLVDRIKRSTLKQALRSLQEYYSALKSKYCKAEWHLQCGRGVKTGVSDFALSFAVVRGVDDMKAEIDRLIKEKAQIYEKIEFELKPRIYELEERLEPLEEQTYNYATGKDDGSLLTAYVKNALSKI